MHGSRLLLQTSNPTSHPPCVQVGLLGGDATRIHCNPDCGLKTRKWEEVLPSIRNLVAAAQLVRGELAAGQQPATPAKAAAAGSVAGASSAAAPAAPAAEHRASCTAGCCAQGE